MALTPLLHPRDRPTNLAGRERKAASLEHAGADARHLRLAVAIE